MLVCPASAWLREEASSVRVNVQKLLVTSDFRGEAVVVVVANVIVVATYYYEAMADIL